MCRGRSFRCDLQATRIIRQQNQLIDESPQQLQRHQERTVTILAVANHRPTRARIDYAESTTKAQSDKEPAVRISHPVANRSYFAERRDGNLILLNAEGKPPTPEEQEILRRHLETFGKPNPLAMFLHAKTVRVGGSIVVPKEVASELLGLAGNDAEAEQLTLHLREVKHLDGQPCAVFQTVLKTNHADSSMNLLMRGQLQIEIHTCRTKAIALRGPVAMSEARGPAQGRFVVSTNGTLKISVDATFGESARLSSRASSPSNVK